MTFGDYCKITENSKNKLFYNFNDKKNVDSEKIKATSVFAFIKIRNAEIMKLQTKNNIDYVTLDLNFSEVAEFLKKGE